MGRVKSLITALFILILLVLAAWQLGQAGLLAAKAWAAPILIENAWEKAKETGLPEKPWSWSDSVPTAKMVVPKLNITRFVLRGDNMRNLAFGPVLQRKGTSRVLFGHRDTHFRFLEYLNQGDFMFFEDAGEEPEKWVVVQQDISKADDLYVPQKSPTDYLVLITCYPFGELNPDTSQRYVVWLQRA